MDPDILEQLKLRLEVETTNKYDSLIQTHYNSEVEHLKRNGINTPLDVDSNYYTYIEYMDAAITLKMEPDLSSSQVQMLQATKNSVLWSLKKLADDL